MEKSLIDLWMRRREAEETRHLGCEVFSGDRKGKARWVWKSEVASQGALGDKSHMEKWVAV